MRIWYNNIILFLLKLSALLYRSPINLNYWWNFGSIAMCFLIMQILTGLFLAMFYNPSIFFAYSSIMYINNEVYFGWWIRSLHANGASFFFFFTYLHMLRSIYYGSFHHPRQGLWKSGIVLLILMIITAFLGYVLPWGQMSFWAAMVITNLLSALPLIGPDLAFLLWGGYTIHDATLHRFYALHFILPFIIFIILILHLSFLHEKGSNNPIGIIHIHDFTPFTPYYILKDVLGICLILIILLYIVFKAPDLLGHSVNYDLANFLITPSHIVPEWYLLFFYAILRSVPDKLFGFFLMGASIITLYYFPKIMKFAMIRSSSFKPWHALWFWIFVSICYLLSWIGGLPVILPYLPMSQNFTFFYFIILLLIFPIGNLIERVVYDELIYTVLRSRKFIINNFWFEIAKDRRLERKWQLI
jgi:ubiquinol-cytochrome c reductase cytochrome b/c1 subunit